MHVVAYEWSGGTVTVKPLAKAEGPAELALRLSPTANVGQLIFIRGHSNSDWLFPLCAQLRIDPEFLRRHLDILLPQDYFDLPPLPSTFTQGLALKFVTISNRLVALTRSQLQDLQMREDDAVKKYQRHLGSSGVLGESIVRRWVVHDEWTSTLEQNISICLKRKGESWTALAWFDCGQDLTQGPGGPWLETGTTPYSFRGANQCKPTIQHLPKAALTFRNTKSSDAPGNEDSGIAQNLRLLPLQYGSFIDANVASTDAFYALSELFEMSAASESQFLNMMQIQVKKVVGSTSMQMQDSQNRLKRIKTLVDDHVQYLQQILEVIQNRDIFDWSTLQPDNAETSNSAAIFSDGSRYTTSSRRVVSQVVSNFQHLLTMAQRLSQQCFEGTQIIMNTSMLEESRRSIKLGEYAARLSFLAFLFLPLTFTTGFFGMNFREFGQGELSVWIFCTVLVPVMAFGCMLCFWNEIVRFYHRRRHPSSRPK